jgi:hypothetical protein
MAENNIQAVKASKFLSGNSEIERLIRSRN